MQNHGWTLQAEDIDEIATSIFQSLLPSFHFKRKIEHTEHQTTMLRSWDKSAWSHGILRWMCLLLNLLLLPVFTSKMAAWLADALDTRRYEKITSHLSPKSGSTAASLAGQSDLMYLITSQHLPVHGFSGFTSLLALFRSPRAGKSQHAFFDIHDEST